VVVVARNEAGRIVDCLSSVAEADERLLVDHGSSDGTATLAEACGARVMPGEGPLSSLRELGCAAAHGTWILCLDADERLPINGLARIRAAIHNAPPEVSGFRLPIRTYVGDRFLRWGGYYPAARVRLFRRDAVRWPLARVHERPEVRGAVVSLDLAIEHPGFRDLEHFRQKQRRYAAWAAADMRDAGVRPGLLEGGVRASWRLLRSYVFRGGFLMGGLGWSMARVQAATVWRRTRWAREGIPIEWVALKKAKEGPVGLLETRPFGEIKGGRHVRRV